jgi:vacuolar-type H+-ATPase subunit I/STV1
MRIAIALLLITLPLAAAAKKPTTAQLQAQVKRLTEERDSLKQKLASTEDIQQELAAAQQARDLAKAEAEAARKEADQVRGTLQENERGGDAILKDVKAARQEAEDAKAEATKLRAENEELRTKVSAVPAEGDLVVLGPEIQPARPLNLNRVVPRLKSSGFFTARPKGVVVVNVLVNEKGEVVASRLIQGLPGEGQDEKDAGEACVEAAKKLVFDPATSKDGKTRFKVWQGVGFYLD